MAPRTLRIAASATSTLALVAAGIAATTTSAQAVPDPDVDTTLCTDAPVPGGVQPVWTGGFAPGQAVHGLTTTHGVTPEAFTGTYVSTLANGAGRGKDILLFRMQGSRITRTNLAGDVSTDAGIWAGMSGSPVYDADDNLIGSVSYGFSGAPSNLAGVTPAKDILDIQNAPAATTVAPKAIAVPKSVSRAAAASTTTTADSAADYGDIHQLTLPKVSVGTPGKTATKLAARSRYFAKKAPGANLKFTTASSVTDLDPAEAIVPGGNVATSFSHGDVALAAVGTITAVCGDKVFAYGHPDDFDGNKATETFHAAAAADIQEDTTFGSYKLANIDMDPIGQITQDRLSGVLGITGQLPAETTITTNTTVDGDTSSATTKVSVPAAVSTALQMQLFNDALSKQDAYVNGGEALMTWTINYTPKGGAAANFSRTQRITSPEYFAEQLSYDVASDVEFLQFGSDTKVAINSITVDSELKPDYNALRLSKVEVRRDGTWVKVKNGQRVTAHQGKNFPVQITLTPATPDSVATPVVKRLDTFISASRGPGLLDIVGANDYYGDFEDLTISVDDEGSDDEEFYYESDPLTLPEVLKALSSQKRYDSVLSNQFWTNSIGDPKVTRRSTSSPAVTGGEYVLQLSYKK